MAAKSGEVVLSQKLYGPCGSLGGIAIVETRSGIESEGTAVRYGVRAGKTTESARVERKTKIRRV